jgi:hypothetical protein
MAFAIIGERGVDTFQKGQEFLVAVTLVASTQNAPGGRIVSGKQRKSPVTHIIMGLTLGQEPGIPGEQPFERAFPEAIRRGSFSSVRQLERCLSRSVKWSPITRYARQRIEALADAPRSGAPRSIDGKKVEEVQTRAIYKNERKSDRHDAMMLARLARMDPTLLHSTMALSGGLR